MENRIQSDRAEFAPQIDDIKAMWHQDVTAARQRLAEQTSNVGEFVSREPVKALGIALCVGVVLGWLIRRL